MILIKYLIYIYNMKDKNELKKNLEHQKNLYKTCMENKKKKQKKKNCRFTSRKY